MSIIAIIPARKNSQRIPGKNKKEFHGRPIIAYSIRAAQASELFNRIIVSTDDPEIAEIAEAYGAEVHERSPEMAVDEVGTQAVAREVLVAADIDSGIAGVLYPCAPMLSEFDLIDAYNVVASRPASFVIASNEHRLEDIGMFYMGNAENFLSEHPLVNRYTAVQPIPSNRAIDINTIEDWQRAERMYGELLKTGLSKCMES